MTEHSNTPIRAFRRCGQTCEALCTEQAHGFKLLFTEQDPDIQILDIQAFRDLDHLMASRLQHAAPALIVVANPAQTLSALSMCGDLDEICRSDDLASEWSYRLARLVARRRYHPSPQEPRYIEHTDPLTGLPNRLSAMEILGELVDAAEHNSPVSVILLDLDHFKQFNDTFGHGAGDEALVSIAKLIEKHRGERIHAFRLGGEEFIVLIEADGRGAWDFAEFLRVRIEEHRLTSERFPGVETQRITASFGVATALAGQTVQDVIEHADMNMYQAKSEGRNRICGGPAPSGEVGDAPQNPQDDSVIRDFENRIRVTTERLANYLTIRGRHLVEHYREEADRDGLTGLYNHRYFKRRMEREIANARKGGQLLSLLFLDIDYFGEVNRTYGYPTGDSALKHVARIMEESVRSVDWVARYGGEEFCVVMPVTGLEDAAMVAERIRQRVASQWLSAYDGRSFQLTVSIGVAELTDADASTVNLVQRAGDKTREAKKAGRNRVY